MTSAEIEPGALAPAIWQRGAAYAQRLRVIVTRHTTPLLVVASAPGGEWLSVTALTPAIRRALRAASALDIAGIELAADITLATARATAAMLAWLDPDLENTGDVAFTIAAQHVLRAFARRLPGFASSSPQFLFDSFLAFDATIVEREGTFHCRVGRPHLAAVFGLTGGLRGRMRLADGRALELYPEAG
ncbi:MAG: hypothetical protein WKG01_10015 [Kofleriaceae bacterium]